MASRTSFSQTNSTMDNAPEPGFVATSLPGSAGCGAFLAERKRSTTLVTTSADRAAVEGASEAAITPRLDKYLSTADTTDPLSAPARAGTAGVSNASSGLRTA